VAPDQEVGDVSVTINVVPGRPSGLGTSAAALAQAGRPARVTGSLYCPPAVRDDPALAGSVQQHLADWAAGVGLAPGAVAGLGRLAVLAHPDTDDVARLQVAARLLAVGRLLAGAAPGTDTQAAAAAPQAPGPASALTSTLAQALDEAIDEAIDEVYHGCALPDQALPVRPTPAPLATASPALLSALAALGALPASPYQVERVRREYETLSATATGSGPCTPWEHLSLGHINAYTPALAALDAVDGYELPPAAAADPQLRRAQRLAALAACLLHDIASPAPAGLTAAIARTDGLGPGAAGRRAAAIHDEAMRAFQHHATALAAASGTDPAARRYLAGLWTWLGGHRTWHAVT
jgi:2-methylisoborneol synthase